MAHRDDHQAALLRAEALERELADAKEALAEKERVLAERDANDAEREADDAEREEARADDEASKAAARKDAEAILDELRRRGAEAAAEFKEVDRRERARAGQNEDRAEARKTRRRIVHSASPAGGLAEPGLVIAALPIFGITTFAMALTTMPISWCFGIAGAVVATLFFFAYVYAPIRAKQLPAWVAALPYAVPGYLDLLARRAPIRDECTLVVTLEFAGAPPADLATLMKSVDGTLQPDGDDCFRRPFPISVHHSKGHRWSNHDTNWPLHRWFQELEERVLRPVHELHPIASVKLARAARRPLDLP